MAKQIGSDEARGNFRDLLDDVERSGEHVTILRYNKPVVVVVGVAWYEKAKAVIEGGPDGSQGT